MSQNSNPTSHIIQMQNLPPSPHTLAHQADEQFKRDHAYKYFGYPNFCKFMASDNDFFLLRRFGELNSRVLLKMQFEIMKLENQLQFLDKKIMDDTDPGERNDSFQWDESWNPNNKSFNSGLNRKQLLDELQRLLKEYSKWH